MPPAPSGAVISYGRNRVPGAKAIRLTIVPRGDLGKVWMTGKPYLTDIREGLPTTLPESRVR